MLETNLFNGPTIRLTSINEQDVQLLKKWEEESQYTRAMTSSPSKPRTSLQISKWIEAMQNSSRDFIFAIRPLEGNEFIGITMLDDVNWPNGVASISIVIGNEAFRGKGIGRETMKLMLEYGFNELNLHRITLNVFSYNYTAIRLYESLGFVHEGTHREYGIRNGERYDMLIYGLLRHEWANK